MNNLLYIFKYIFSKRFRNIERFNAYAERQVAAGKWLKDADGVIHIRSLKDKK